MPLIALVSMLTTLLIPFLAGLLQWPIWIVVPVGAWAAYSYFSTRSGAAVNSFQHFGDGPVLAGGIWRAYSLQLGFWQRLLSSVCTPRQDLPSTCVSGKQRYAAEEVVLLFRSVCSLVKMNQVFILVANLIGSVLLT